MRNLFTYCFILFGIMLPLLTWANTTVLTVSIGEAVEEEEEEDATESIAEPFSGTRGGTPDKLTVGDKKGTELDPSVVFIPQRKGDVLNIYLMRRQESARRVITFHFETFERTLGVISWSTDPTSQKTGEYEGELVSLFYETAHAMAIEKINKGVTYYFRVTAFDLADNWAHLYGSFMIDDKAFIVDPITKEEILIDEERSIGEQIPEGARVERQEVIVIEEPTLPPPPKTLTEVPQTPAEMNDDPEEPLLGVVKFLGDAVSVFVPKETEKRVKQVSQYVSKQVEHTIEPIVALIERLAESGPIAIVQAPYRFVERKLNLIIADPIVVFFTTLRLFFFKL